MIECAIEGLVDRVREKRRVLWWLARLVLRRTVVVLVLVDDVVES